MRRSSAKELTLLVYKDILPGGAAYGKKVLVPAGCDRRHTVRWQSRTAVSKCARVLRELSAAAPQSRRKLIRPRWEKRAKEIAKGYPSSGLCR